MSLGSTPLESACNNLQLDHISVCHDEATGGRYSPLAALVDLEPGVVGSVHSGPFSQIGRPDNLVFGKSGAGQGLFCRAVKVIDLVLNVVQKEVDGSDCLQGSQWSHLLGKGSATHCQVGCFPFLLYLLHVLDSFLLSWSEKGAKREKRDWPWSPNPWNVPSPPFLNKTRSCCIYMQSCVLPPKYLSHSFREGTRRSFVFWQYLIRSFCYSLPFPTLDFVSSYTSNFYFVLN